MHALNRSRWRPGLIERSHRSSAIANKAGLFGYHQSADSQLTTTIRMADGSSSGWAGQPSTRLSEIDSAKLAATASRKVRALEESAEDRARQLHRGARAHRGRRHRAPDGRRVQRAQHRGGPDVSQQARRRHSARRKSIPRVRHAAQGPVRSASAILAVDRRTSCPRAPSRGWTKAWSPISPTTVTGPARPASNPRRVQAADLAAEAVDGGGGGGAAAQPSLIMEGGDANARSTDLERGTRTARHAFLVHPLRQPADLAAYRPHARRSVPD